MFGSGNAILIISNEEINDIMKIVKSPGRKKKKRFYETFLQKVMVQIGLKKFL